MKQDWYSDWLAAIDHQISSKDAKGPPVLDRRQRNVPVLVERRKAMHDRRRRGN